MNQGSRKALVFWMIGVLVIVIGAVLGSVALSVLSGRRTYAFFYPYPGTSRFGSEKRVLHVGKSRLGLEALLVREYVLGPMNYRFHLKIPDGLQVRNVWLVPDSLLVVNLNGFLLDYLRKDNEDCRLFLEGLILTLRNNTKVLRLSVLCNNQVVTERAGTYALDHPLPVDKEP